MAQHRTTAKRGGDPKVSVTHRIAEGLPVRSLKIAPKSSKELCIMCQQDRRIVRYARDSLNFVGSRDLTFHIHGAKTALLGAVDRLAGAFGIGAVGKP